MMTSEIEQNCATILWKRTRQLVLRIEKFDFSYIFNTKYEETLQYYFERLNEVMQLRFPRLSLFSLKFHTYND